MKLNVEQQKIIELEPNGHMLVKGVAGSGKTTVAVHRASLLHEHYCPEKDDNILIVTYNKTLVKYLKYQYEEVDSVNSYNKIDIVNIDSLMHRYFKDYKEREAIEIATGFSPKNTLIKAIKIVEKRYPTVKVMTTNHLDFLQSEIEWIKACDIPDLATYQEVDRIGRSEGGSGNPQKLLKNSPIRESIYTLMEVYDELLLKERLIDFKTMNRIALNEAMKGIGLKYTHIIIDESQDLSKVQLKFLKQIYANRPHGTILFVADNTQSIYAQSWLGKGRAYATVGFDMSGKSRTLSKNYRTTTEISKAAYALIENDAHINNNADFVKPALIDRHGHKPIYHLFAKNIEQTNYLANEIEVLKEQYALRDICIVAKNHQTLTSLKVELEAANVPCEFMNRDDMRFDNDKLKLTTMHSIKGLEFKVVFLINLDDKIIPDKRMLGDEESLSEERKLMYVGMTRAKELLYLSSVGQPSMFMKDIDPALLSMKNGIRLRPYQPIVISNYKFTAQLHDVHSKEEAVRQWLLKELEDMYAYPESLMQIEYPVQQFSKRGYVDVAIEIEQDGERVPYLFAEVKAFGSGIMHAVDQLKSYMRTSPDVKYGIATDGVELKIIDQTGKEIKDVPVCELQFLPSDEQERTYMNLRNRREYGYARDLDVAEQITVKDLETGAHLTIEDHVHVPLIGDVVAGNPQIANEHFEDTVLLPKEWVIQTQDTFALRVTGDSMKDAGIDIGDLVIVHRQEAVDNQDIVIAVIGENATMKRYMQMGGTVLLIPENPKYEPLNMNPEDVQINGKVIGVLKG